MWIKDIRKYESEIYENEKMIYSGDVSDVPEELKEREILSMKLEHKKLIINI